MTNELSRADEILQNHLNRVNATHLAILAWVGVLATALGAIGGTWLTGHQNADQATNDFLRTHRQATYVKFLTEGTLEFNILRVGAPTIEDKDTSPHHRLSITSGMQSASRTLTLDLSDVELIGKTEIVLDATQLHQDETDYLDQLKNLSSCLDDGKTDCATQVGVKNGLLNAIKTDLTRFENDGNAELTGGGSG